MVCQFCGAVIDKEVYVCPCCGNIIKTKKDTKFIQIFFWGSIGFSILTALISLVGILMYSAMIIALVIQLCALGLGVAAFCRSKSIKEEVILKNCILLHFIWEIIFTVALVAWIFVGIQC